MKNKIFKISLALLLCLAMILPFIPFNNKVEAKVNNWQAAGTGFKGKKISILGDSISTFEGVSNDGSVNSSIANNNIYYYATNNYGVVRKDTWWQQAIDTLDMTLCVNNADSGSAVMGNSTANDHNAAWKNRYGQLHQVVTTTSGSTSTTTNVNPDIIAVYLGTNDIKNMTSDFPTFSDYQSAILNEIAGTGDCTYKFSYYVRMIQGIMNTYQNAEVYCFTLLPNEHQSAEHTKSMNQFNQSVRDMVSYYQNKGKKIYLVDLYNDSGITPDLAVLDTFLANTLHPNAAGMDCITNCFLASLMANSQYSTKSNWYNVSYNLDDVYVQEGKVNKAGANTTFTVPLLPTHQEYDMSVRVTMGGQDITASAYSGGRVFVEKVTGNIEITAVATYETKNYRWENQNGVMVSCTEDGNDYNVLGAIDDNTSAHVGGVHQNGVFDKARFGLEIPVILRDEEPWVIEWRANGRGGSSMIFSESESIDRNDCYIYHRDGNGILSMGYRNDYKGEYRNFGYHISDNLTLDGAQYHIYRLVNEISDSANRIHLYIDGAYAGVLNEYNIGGTNQNKEDNWLTGRDFRFAYMGTVGHPLNHIDITYVQVWEGGQFDTLRLEQLVQEFDELNDAVKNYTGYAAYQTAVNHARDYLAGVDKTNTQQLVDSLAEEIEAARNALTQSATEQSGEIYSVELLTGDHSNIGKQTAVQVITAPDVVALRVDTQKILTCTSKIQTIEIDGQDTLVKVWLVSWKELLTTPTTTTYEIRSYTSLADAATDDAAVAASGKASDAKLENDSFSVSISFQ